MKMPSKETRYSSIAELRASLYPDSAPMLSLEKDDTIELPIRLTGNSLRIVERIAGSVSEEIEDASEQE